MLSIFPTLLDYNLLAVFILRIALALTFLCFAYTILVHKQDRVTLLEGAGISSANILLTITMVLEFIVGTALALGAFSQIAGILGGILMLVAVGVQKKYPQILSRNTSSFYLILATLSFSFLFLGAGVFAFDMAL